MPYVGHYGDLFAIAAQKNSLPAPPRRGVCKGQHRYAAYEEITPALEYTYAFRRHLAYKRLHGLPCGGVGVYRYAVTPAKHADARYVVCMFMGDEYGGYVLYSFPRKGKGSRYGAGALPASTMKRPPSAPIRVQLPEEPLNKGFIYICYIYPPLQPENYANDGGYGYEYYRVQALQPLYVCNGKQQPKEYEPPEVDAAEKRAAGESYSRHGIAGRPNKPRRRRAKARKGIIHVFIVPEFLQRL